MPFVSSPKFLLQLFVIILNCIIHKAIYTAHFTTDCGSLASVPVIKMIPLNRQDIVLLYIPGLVNRCLQFSMKLFTQVAPLCIIVRKKLLVNIFHVGWCVTDFGGQTGSVVNVAVS